MRLLIALSMLLALFSVAFCEQEVLDSYLRGQNPSGMTVWQLHRHIVSLLRRCNALIVSLNAAVDDAKLEVQRLKIELEELEKKIAAVEGPVPGESIDYTNLPKRALGNVCTLLTHAILANDMSEVLLFA